MRIILKISHRVYPDVEELTMTAEVATTVGLDPEDFFTRETKRDQAFGRK